MRVLNCKRLPQIAFALAALSPICAQDGSRSGSLYLFGDWGGERTRLERRGVVLNLIYVNDLLKDTGGDLANWSRVRGTLDIDFGKAEVARGLKFHITAMWQAGGNLGAQLGAIANPSSNASFNLTRLDSWWFEQSLAHDKLFVRAGQFAGLDSYGVQPYGKSYLIEPLGYALGNLFAATYEPFAPAGTPAAEVRYVPSRHFYLKSAIFSGNRDPLRDDPSGTHFRFKDTPVVASEVGILVDPTPSSTSKTYPGAYAFGATVNPGRFANIVTGTQSKTNYLVYCTADQRIYRAEPGGEGGLDVTFAFDWTPGDITWNYSQITAGVRYHGLIPGRRKDALSAGVVYSRAGAVGNRGTEKAIEVNYSLELRPWLTVQPVWQRYIDLGANPHSRVNTIAGFRTTVVM